MQHAMISIESISKLMEITSFSVYIIHSKLSSKSLTQLKSFFKKNRVDYFIIKVKNDFFFSSGNNFTSHLNNSMFLRLYAPYVISCDRILYLDCDTIVKDFFLLEKLYSKTFFYKKKVCALMASSDSAGSIAVKLFNENIMSTELYFNSGVMMMNLEFMRSVSLKEILQFHKKMNRELTFPDQDIINYFFNGQIKPLLPVYNALNNSFDFAYDKTNLSKYRLKVLKNNIAIKHFFGRTKPWKIVTRHNREYFFMYLLLCRKNVFKLKYSYVLLGFITLSIYPILKVIKNIYGLLNRCLKKALN